MTRPLDIVDLGVVGYSEADAHQDALVSARQQDQIDDRLLLLSHPPVITYGRRAGTRHLLASLDVLRRRGVELCATDRGGDITFHGPGQQVAYLIARLQGDEQDVPRLFAILEGAVCATLQRFGISATGGSAGGAGDRGADLGRAGAWVGRDKICALGMRLSRWVTKHGLALNVDVDLDYFQLITPCGLHGYGVTSMARAAGRAPDAEQVKQALAQELCQALGRTPLWRRTSGLDTLFPASI